MVLQTCWLAAMIYITNIELIGRLNADIILKMGI